MRDGHGPADLMFARLVVRLPMFVAGLLHALGNHVHGALERDALPCLAVRAPVKNVVHAMRAGDELKCRSAFWTQAAVRDGRTRIALNVDDLLVLDIDELAAADAAIRADG